MILRKMVERHTLLHGVKDIKEKYLLTGNTRCVKRSINRGIAE